MRLVARKYRLTYSKTWWRTIQRLEIGKTSRKRDNVCGNDLNLTQISSPLSKYGRSCRGVTRRQWGSFHEFD